MQGRWVYTGNYVQSGPPKVCPAGRTAGAIGTPQQSLGTRDRFEPFGIHLALAIGSKPVAG